MGLDDQVGGESPGRNHRAMRTVLLFQFALEYGPFVLIIVLLILTTLADQVPGLDRLLPQSKVGLYVSLALISLLPFVVRLAENVSRLETRVAANIERQDRILTDIRPSIIEVSLAQAFRLAAETAGHCERIRVFAITSRFVSEHMQPRDFRSQRLELLLGGSGEEADSLLVSEVGLSVLYTWVGHVRRGATQELRLRQFNFYPTEWFVVFDDRLLIMNNYTFDTHSIGRTLTAPDVHVVRGESEGKKLIETKIAVFDALFDAAEIEFGAGAHEGDYRLIKNSVQRRQLGSSDWGD